MAPQLEVRVREVAGTLVVWAIGEADHATSPVLRDALARLADRWQGHMVVDLSGLSFLDSSGLSALVAGYKRVTRAGLSFAVAGLLPQVARVFKTTAIDTLIAVHHSLRDALGGDGPPNNRAQDSPYTHGIPVGTYLAGSAATAPVRPQTAQVTITR